ncbi:hypothetical protein LNKW23_28250 [Paralimibaculum aggregatum]|uniref:Outer membrane protein beta-barrel domain-containing protein n=1 Tax=Paralimibaculum aggregatum TaxID=3036245 RepID=A0ABQ6LK23_9RHOB|nr:hypothetical protein [Limibaculum sp. NKW23]GMG83612.1 hypothetical protein LNKW23_28250 [Limibaculum sp. NKW23]
MTETLTARRLPSLATAGLAAALALAAPGDAPRADGLIPLEDDGWRFVIAPYAFLPLLTDVESGLGGVSTEATIWMDDLLENLNMAFAGRGEAWYDRFGVTVDGYYASLDGGGRSSLGPGPFTLNADIESDQSYVTFLGGYRVLQTEWQPGRGLAVDLMAGARWNRLVQDVDFRLSAGVGPGRVRSIGGNAVWWEPVIGARIGAAVAEDWTLGMRAEFGGFGAGGDNLQWHVLLGADYAITESISLRAGWQFYGIDFEADAKLGRFRLNLFQTGPYLAAAFRF